MSPLPLFMRDAKAAEILQEVIECIPKRTKVYLVGGAARNAVFYDMYKKAPPQRDYDLLLIGDMQAFVKNLRARGFTYGKMRRKHMTVLKKKRIPKPKHIHNDYIYLDIKISQYKTMKENLRYDVNFTINQFALPLQSATSKAWKKKLITYPGAIEDMKRKQLRLNPDDKKIHSGNLFACMRFMSLGFKQPTKQEVAQLCRAFAAFAPQRYPRNAKKLLTYVGGEAQVRKLAGKLGIQENLLSYSTVRKYRKARDAEHKQNRSIKQ